MHEIILTGCKATKLPDYLKAVGILRLITTQADNSARAYWKDNVLVLKTALSKQDIESFFLNEYSPSPIISPWSGRAGFLEGTDETSSKRKGALILDKIEKCSGNRFATYRSIVASIRKVSVIHGLDVTREKVKRLEKLKKAKKLDESGQEELSQAKRDEKELKGSLLQSLRAELDDEFLPWIDTCFALTPDLKKQESQSTPGPLLGSGGNEGSMDFSINHIGYLLKLIDPNSDEPTALSIKLLNNSLFGQTDTFDSMSNIGFLDTLSTGGVNMSTGFEGSSSGNVWDSILSMEGTILFASATTKKFGSGQSSRPSFPFAVAPSLAGDGSLTAKESARPELWLPIWNHSASLAELSTLLSEGRTTLGKKQARNGLDMAEAVASLGANRGISTFQRHGFYERRGQGYYVATHIGTHHVPTTPIKSWIIHDLSQYGWLDYFRRFAKSEHAANRFHTLGRRLEDMLFALSGKEPSKAEAQAVLTLMGDIQSQLATSKAAMDAVKPVPRLSEQWVIAADDGTPAFRIAKALAGLHGDDKTKFPLRAQLFPVERVRTRWVSAETDDEARVFNGFQGALPKAMAQVLSRRLWLADKFDMDDKPLDSIAGVTTDDVMAFLRDPRMDQRIRSLLLGLSLCRIPKNTENSGGEAPLPAAFSLLKLSLTPDWVLQELGRLPSTEKMPVPQGMLAALMAGQSQKAISQAQRRLQASGLGPVFASNALPNLAGIAPERMAAALLIPLRFGATAKLARQALTTPETNHHAA